MKKSKIFSGVLALLFFAQQTMCVPVLASTINSLNNNGINQTQINGGNNTQFDINHQFTNGSDTGFRHYTDFNLSKGDIANLEFNGINKFVNLVDSRINIDGVVNTMKNNNFFNGNAIFVSPQGMAIGASGVLNVGSLTAISPNPTSYLTYTGYNIGRYATTDAIGNKDTLLGGIANKFDLDLSILEKLPGISDKVNLKLLQEVDQTGSIDVLGKIISRQDVNLIGKHVNVGNSTTKAGIFAGIGSGRTTADGALDVQMQTVEQANKLFKALVNTDAQANSGNGFGFDKNGNIIIKAQTIKQVELMLPADKLTLAGKEIAVEKLFDIVDGKYVVKAQEALDALSLELKLDPSKTIKIADVNTALKLALETYNPVSATEGSVINRPNTGDPSYVGANLSSVNIENAYLSAKNIDVNAVSKVDYLAQKGSTLFDRLSGTIMGTLVDQTKLDEKLTQQLDQIVAGTNFTDFEGARAKAEINIGNGSKLVANNDVSVKSLAYANTAIKLSSRRRPAADTTSELFYLLGTKTVSNINVKNGADIKAGNDVNIIAGSKNTINAKIKNPTSKNELLLEQVLNAPSIQVSILKTENNADTKVNVENGATIKSGHDVNVNSFNVTEDKTTLSSIATINKESNDNHNSGLAVAVVLKDSTVNTDTIVDGNVSANNNLNVIAQNIHAEISKAEASVQQAGFFGAGIQGIIAQKVLGVVASKVDGLADVLDKVFKVEDALPSASSAVLVNNSNLNTTAKIGSNAVVNAKNVNVNALAVDLVVNNATTKVDLPKNTDSTTSGGSGSGVTGYMPAPGVAVIVNKQNNNTTALIDGANVNASGNVKVNATTEQPMNDNDFDFALNLIQTGKDIGDLGDIVDGTQEYGFNNPDNPDWDFRTLLQAFTNPVDEVMFDVQNVLFGFKQSGLTSTLGLQGFFNNWAQSTSANPNGIGAAASVVVTDIVNNTLANIKGGTINADNVIVNAANNVVQFNAAGDVSKLWKFKEGAKGGAGGVGGTVLIEGVNSNAVASIDNGAKVTAQNDISINSANQQDFLTLVVTGSKSGGDNGAAISGSTVIQDVTGKTESKVDNAEIVAKNLTVQAGKAKIATVQKSSDKFIDGDPFEDLDGSKFEVGLEEDLSAGNVKRYGDVDFNLGLDTELFPNGDGLTDVGTLTGDALADLNAESEIVDRISNLVITGAIASQAIDDATSGTGSSGVAAGASVNVTEFAKEVNAIIGNGADVTVSDSLNVLADSKSQSLNLAIAGAFAGGINMKKEPGFIENQKDKLKHKADGYLTKVQGILKDVDEAASKKDPTGIVSGADSKLSGAIDSIKNKLNKGDGTTNEALNSVGGNKPDADGNKTADLGSNLTSNEPMVDTADFSTASKNMSGALAGSVNAQINNSKVNASVNGANIKVGKDLNVNANQITRSLNIGGGVAKASTVGAGAAVNFVQNKNETTSSVKNSVMDFTGTDNNLNVKATENNDNVHVAVGVGVAKAEDNSGSMQGAVGGSFNTDVLRNKVVAEVDGTTVTSTSPVAVDINAENHSTSYKGAGAGSINIGSSNSKTAVGAGVSGNINVINKTTQANLKNSTISNAKSVSVVVNKDKTQKTEDLIDVGVAGAVVTGAQSSFTFQGAIGANVINNTISAVIDKSNITSSGDVTAIANSNVSNQNIAGALGFSTSSKGAGFGLGTVVNVVTSNIEAAIKNNSIIDTQGNIGVIADNNELLHFLAVNMGISTGGVTPVSTNAIVNVLNNTMNATIADSLIKNSASVDINSLYNVDIAGITNADSIAIGKGNAAGGNAVVNVLASNVNASIDKADKTTTTDNDITSAGKVSVNATSTENLNVVPIGVSISTGGPVAAAANVAVNVIGNTTSAVINNNNVSAGEVSVIAKDETTSYNRGGTIGASAKAGIGGTILLEILAKDVDAKISNSTVNSTGNVTVNANAVNAFGPKNTASITLSSILKDLEGKTSASEDLDVNDQTTTVLDKIESILNWQMIYDVAVGGSAGVAGSLVAKISQNEVDAAVKSSIINANDLSLAAYNEIYTRNIVGNISAAGNAAIGGSLFVNVNIGNTNAIIDDSVITANGDVTVDSQAIQDFKTIMVIGGGAGTAAVNGSANSNTAKDSVTAKITNSDIKKSNSVTVKAKAKDDVESMNLGVQGAGTASVGGIAYNNNFLNKVHAIISGQKETGINSTGNVTVDAKSSESFSANIAMISGAGTAAVNGVAVANVSSSDIKAQIGDTPEKGQVGIVPEAQKTTVKSSEGKIDVKANHNFNEEKYNDSTLNVTEYMNNKRNDNTDPDEAEKNQVTIDDFSAFMPIVTVLSTAFSGTAAVTGIAVADVVSTSTIAKVANAEIESATGLNIGASTNEVFYNAVSAIAGSGTGASIGGGTVVNVIDGKTSAELVKSHVNKGDVIVNAEQNTNLNSILFMTAVTGEGGAAAGVIGTNTILGETNAIIDKTEIKASDNVNVTADSNIKDNTIGVAASGVGIGAAINGITITNVAKGETNAAIKNESIISKGSTSVYATADTDIFNLIVAGAVSGMGADVGVYAPVNVLLNKVNAYIDNSELSNNSAASVVASSDADLKTLVTVLGFNGIGATIAASAIVNVINNDINAYVSNNTKVQNGKLTVNANQTSDIETLMVAISGGGLSVAGNTNVATNTLGGRIKAYTDNLTATDTLIDVDASSTENINQILTSVAGAGLAGVTGAVSVNTINNELGAEVKNSNITGGSLDIDSAKTTTIQNGIAGGAGGGVGVGGVSIVNVISSQNIAGISKTNSENLNSISVNANTTQNIYSSSYMAAISASVSGAMSANVNVIEGTTKAYIDTNQNSNLQTDGALVVNANETLLLDAIAGSLSGAALGIAGAGSVNVNVINNAVIADLYGNGNIKADSVDVLATSDIDYSIGTAAIGASGSLAMSTTVAVTSIGGKFKNHSDTDFGDKFDVNQEVELAEGKANQGQSLHLIKKDDGSYVTSDSAQSGSLDYAKPNVDLNTSTTSKTGTLARVATDIISNNGVNVIAKNTTDFVKTSATGAAGIYGVGAGVSVTDTNYTTKAIIERGNIVAKGNDVNVKATNNTNYNLANISATGGLAAVNVGVDYFKNNSITEASTGYKQDGTTGNASVDAGDHNVNVRALSEDNIYTKALSVGISGIKAAISVALAETNNTARAVVGSAVKANDLNIEAINSSKLESSAISGSVALYSANASVNRVKSNAITEAIIDASGKNIKLTHDLNLIAATTGIDVDNNIYVGQAAYGDVSYDNYGAVANSQFNALVRSGNVEAANNANIQAGLKATKSGENYTIGSKTADITATVNSKKIAASVFKGGSTTLYASASGNAKAGGTGGSVKAGNKIDVDSKLNKTASSSSEELSISGVEIGAITQKTQVDGTVEIYSNGLKLVSDTVDMDVYSNGVATAKSLSGNISLINGSGSVTNSIVEDDVKITSGNIYADTITMDIDANREAKLQDSSIGLSAFGLGVTDMKAIVGSDNGETKTGVTLAGTIGDKNQTTDGKANSLTITVLDDSKASNEATNASLSFFGGNSLNIESIVQSKIFSNLGGTVRAKDIDYNSTLTRNVIANAASGNAGLTDLSIMNLKSIIKQGNRTDITGQIFAETFDVDSQMINSAESYVQENDAGLIALVAGITKNNVENSAQNVVFFYDANVNTDNINVIANSNSKSYMHKTSDSVGFIVIKGGKVQNDLKGSSQIDVRNTKINVTGGDDSDANFSVINKASTPKEMRFTDDTGGFIASGGAELKNTINQSSNMYFYGNSEVKASGNLVLSVDNGTEFSQKTYADGSGFTAHNEGTSELTANINNAINIGHNGTGALVQGKNVNINMNSTNTLSSKAYSEAHHFAGSPSAYSKVNLTVNNNVNIKNGGTLAAYDNNPQNTEVNINFMNNSTQDITQIADLFVRAGVATGDVGGGIDFETNNKVNIASGGKITSGRDVFINFNKGVENLSSEISSKKISHIAFGIPITVKDSWKSVKSTAANEVHIDGEIIAGSGNQKNITINKDGVVTEGSLLENQDYTKTEEQKIEGAPAGSDKAKQEENKIQSQINELKTKLDKLTQDKETNQDEINALKEQIDSLQMQIIVLEYIDSLQAGKKMTNAEFRAVIKKVLDDNKIKNPELVTEKVLNIFISENNQKLFVDATNGDLVFVYDRTEDGKIVLDNNNNPTFIGTKINEDGDKVKVNYQFKYNGNNIATDNKGNYILVNSDNAELSVKEYTYEGLVAELDSSMQLDKSGLETKLSTLKDNQTINDSDILDILNEYYVKDANSHLTEIKTSIQNDKIADSVSGLEIDNAQIQNKVSAELAEVRGNIGKINKKVNGQEISLNTYNNKVLYDTATAESLIELQDVFDQAKNNLEVLNNEIMKDLDHNLQDTNSKLADLNGRLAYIQQNGIDDVLIKNGAFLFNDLTADGGRIAIYAEKGKSKITGSGKMELTIADILINNHSKYDLVFKDLLVGNGATGVSVDGVNYSGSDSGTMHYPVLDYVKVYTKGTEDNLGCITVNNYYDPNRPLVNSQNGSNLIFNGVINTNSGDVKIYNEGGNVEINDTVTAETIDVSMPQGSFTQNTKGKEYILKDGDTLFAGKTIDITAPKFNIAGIMQAGVADKNITITEGMLDHLIKDEITGLYLIDLNKGNKSVYMNETNNIKAAYDKATDTIQLYGVQITDNAAINLNATTDLQDTIYIASTAKLKHADGYGKINIVNQTNSHLEVGNLQNNKIAGGVHFTVNGEERDIPVKGRYQSGEHWVTEYQEMETLTGGIIKIPYLKKEPIYSPNGNYAGEPINLAKNNGDSAITSVVTNGTGDLNVYGRVSSGQITGTDNNVVNITTNGNLNVKNHDGYTINTNGDVTLTKNTANGGINIDGFSKTTNGDFIVNNNGNAGTTITKNGSVESAIGNVIVNNNVGNLTVAGQIAGTVKGDVTVNSKAGIDVLENAYIKAIEGELNITNDTEGINIAGFVNNNNGNIVVTNNGTKGTNISTTGSINGAFGDITVDNKQGNLIVDGNINSQNAETDGNDINLSTETGLLEIGGDINNQAKGNITITAKGTEGLKTKETSAITATEGDVTLTNANKSVILAGDIANNKGNIFITNNGNDKTSIDASALIENKYGNINVVDKNGNVYVDGDIFSHEGTMDGNNVLVEAETGSVNIKGDIKNTVKGNIDIVANNGLYTHNTPSLIETNEGNITITNNTDRISIDSSINNNKGNITITNNNGANGTLLGENSNISNASGDITVDNKQGNLNVAGNITSKESKDGGNNVKLETETGSLVISGTVDNQVKGNIDIISKGDNGLNITETGIVHNHDGKVTVSNSLAGVTVAGKLDNDKGNMSVTNNGVKGIGVVGNGSITNDEGILDILNQQGGIKVETNAQIANSNSAYGDNLNITNNGEGLIDILGQVTNAKGNLVVDANNVASGINVGSDGKLANADGNSTITNKGSQGTTVAGELTNNGGNLTITNEAGGILVDNSTSKKGLISNNSNIDGEKTIITNNGDGGITVKGDIKNEGKSSIEITNTNNKIHVADGGSIYNNSTATGENMTITNSGANGMLVEGIINNVNGDTSILNSNVANTSSIVLAATGVIKNDKGDLNITNNGTSEIGIDVDGLISAKDKTITIDNENSNIQIGEYASDNDFYIAAKDIIINQNNGDILNGIIDPVAGKNQNHDLGNKDHAYKTLISTTGNLSMNVVEGNIGKDTHALAGKESGFSVNASTRDYTESINVKVDGLINTNQNKTGESLTNIRAKNSGLNVDKISSNGNVMITAADWKQADQNVAPSDPNYFIGHSLVNKSQDGSANVVGKNISLIASDNIGAKENKFTYEQLEGGSVSSLAENDIYQKGLGNKDNVWQVISKRGNVGLDFNGDAVIREVTSGKDLLITSTGANLTIYDLGLTPNIAFDDDILYPHDRLKLGGNGGIIPEKVEIIVTDTNPATRVDSEIANSTLNVFNGYVKGRKDGTPDVVLKADNIIAHAHDAASSGIYNKKRPNGFDATKDRTYANDYMDPSAEKNLKAKGFNTYGPGSELVFDVQGVSPDAVVKAGDNIADRNYHSQEPVYGRPEFHNDKAFTDTVYKANDVTLSLNSSKEGSPKDNRGMKIDKFYADNAYVDTKDLNLNADDVFITNYGEFRNGNLGGDEGALSISDDYRWITIVDNDYKRNIANLSGSPVTSQLYTTLSGSFQLHMGNIIALGTEAPVVVYNPYEVVIIPHTENSFYRLTYKDDKIQRTTTTPEFEDIDKSTYIPTKREFIRFQVKAGDGYVNVSDTHKKVEPRIISVEDISRGGVLVTHNGTLKRGEKFVITLDYQGMSVTPEVEVMRVDGNKAGLKFINLNKAVANKILYMNLSLEHNESEQLSKK